MSGPTVCTPTSANSETRLTRSATSRSIKKQPSPALVTAANALRPPPPLNRESSKKKFNVKSPSSAPPSIKLDRETSSPARINFSSKSTLLKKSTEKRLNLLESPSMKKSGEEPSFYSSFSHKPGDGQREDPTKIVRGSTSQKQTMPDRARSTTKGSSSRPRSRSPAVRNNSVKKYSRSSSTRSTGDARDTEPIDESKDLINPFHIDAPTMNDNDDLMTTPKKISSRSMSRSFSRTASSLLGSKKASKTGSKANSPGKTSKKGGTGANDPHLSMAPYNIEGVWFVDPFVIYHNGIRQQLKTIQHMITFFGETAFSVIGVKKISAFLKYLNDVVGFVNTYMSIDDDLLLPWATAETQEQCSAILKKLRDTRSHIDRKTKAITTCLATADEFHFEEHLADLLTDLDDWSTLLGKYFSVEEHSLANPIKDCCFETDKSMLEKKIGKIIMKEKNYKQYVVMLLSWMADETDRDLWVRNNLGTLQVWKYSRWESQIEDLEYYKTIRQIQSEVENKATETFRYEK